MKCLSCFFLFAIICAEVAYANQDSTEVQNSSNIILKEYNDSVQNFTKGKIYLKPERIFSDGSIFWLMNEQDSLELPLLGYDNMGYYVLPKQVDALCPWYQCTNVKCG